MKISIGILRVTLRFSYRRGGTIYYQRAVPIDLRERYGKALVKVNLDTTDLATAARKIKALNREVEAEWSLLRATPEATPKTIGEQAEELLKAWDLSPHPAPNDNDGAESAFYDLLDGKRERHARGDEAVYREAPGSAYLSPVEVEAVKLLAGTKKPRLSDALDLYLKVHPKRNNEKFCAFARASFAKLTGALGDKAIEALSRDDSHRFVSMMVKQGLATASIRRLLNTNHAIVGTYLREKEVNKKNPLSSVPIPDEGLDAVKSRPYSTKELASLVEACRSKDDERRWLIAMISDTGARLAEVTGLTLDDIDLTAPVPHIIIQPHPWRSLKETVSCRKVPLLGEALWAAKRIKEKAGSSQRFAFPLYTTEKKTNANSASSALNKWIKEAALVDHTVKELRHTIADRLRDVQCPADIRLSIGGWTLKGVGEGYGDGYTLAVKAEWLKKVLPVTST